MVKPEFWKKVNDSWMSKDDGISKRIKDHLGTGKTSDEIDKELQLLEEQEKAFFLNNMDEEL
ncbi:hypothetical protein [Butyrivibrio sp. NC2002]|uniref:hypothetical protein n=1 Tax=Butyrivibrio sp. NC2002 TaxID=1410610 RepID=UPI00055D7D98|nr:hypothetical protein [Butyrivibrio sp. NC2002]